MATSNVSTTTGCGGGSEETPLKVTCDNLRGGLLTQGDRIKALLDHSDMKAENEYPGQRSEMKANVMLAYRHSEDARMRIGKILQAAGDGVSILDK